MTKSQIIDQIFTAFRQYGDQSYGERVTMAEHMLQSAVFAERDGAHDTLIAATVLHDYGHLIHDLPEDIADHGIDAIHEQVGADYLAQYFVPAVTEPGRLHVAAKRYLCAVDIDYFSTLSPASIQSLELQGGPFNQTEIDAFEDNLHFKDAIRLRRYDDFGKVPNMVTPDLEHYRSFLEAGLR
ncbi:MAG: metal-dependent phosphohydrolase [Chloroflexota bacterium]